MPERQLQRLVFTYKTACLIVVVMSVFWCGVFAYQEAWALAGAEVFAVAVGVTGWLLVRSGRLNAALIFPQIAFLFFITGFCLMFDVPNGDIPRVTHLFLLLLALIGYINHLRRKSTLQLVIVGVSLCGFITFSSTNYALPFAQPIPDSIRVTGTWLNSTLITVMLCGCIYAIELKFLRQRRIVSELRAAVRNDELELFFQPQVNRYGYVIGAEVLLRWKHPQRGYIMPGDFITVAEDNGLMPLLGSWVLKEACRTLAIWERDPVLRKLTLAVNVSASQFNIDGFDRTVLETVRLCQADPTKLKLELTESVIVSGMAEVVAKMDALRDIGIMFALDDFGTGYSSLSYLRSLPIYQLKIDRSFVQGAVESERGASLVKRIVQIGLDLDFVVLAEGVETAAQQAFMLNCGCHEFQGYYFGRPLSCQDFETHARRAEAEPDNLAHMPLPGRLIGRA